MNILSNFVRRLFWLRCSVDSTTCTFDDVSLTQADFNNGSQTLRRSSSIVIEGTVFEVVNAPNSRATHSRSGSLGTTHSGDPPSPDEMPEIPDEETSGAGGTMPPQPDSGPTSSTIATSTPSPLRSQRRSPQLDRKDVIILALLQELDVLQRRISSIERARSVTVDKSQSNVAGVISSKPKQNRLSKKKFSTPEARQRRSKNVDEPRCICCVLNHGSSDKSGLSDGPPEVPGGSRKEYFRGDSRNETAFLRLREPFELQSGQSQDGSDTPILQPEVIKQLQEHSETTETPECATPISCSQNSGCQVRTTSMPRDLAAIKEYRSVLAIRRKIDLLENVCEESEGLSKRKINVAGDVPGVDSRRPEPNLSKKDAANNIPGLGVDSRRHLSRKKDDDVTGRKSCLGRHRESYYEQQEKGRDKVRVEIDPKMELHSPSPISTPFTFQRILEELDKQAELLTAVSGTTSQEGKLVPGWQRRR
ncbi:hypothetical protein M422DRAFT_70084 [Sphaerobolus stellatus SS14]|uniref:Uncharacterized protein n=1 Tax=Sphaerobolus stellatus (strain SS14) TaxID=990650 RepID=A0A0C9TWN0_SPHS4|nr:hypothetical protein M422DRAFT_70084 [Sphaerobolus stellatus SS14]